jgi:hypothetical protein
MEWTDTYIKTWFFPRNNIPASIQCGAPDLTEFGQPVSWFNGCDIKDNFVDHRIVFTTTFCGAFAGASGVYGTEGICQIDTTLSSNQNCVNQVATHCSDYADAYVVFLLDWKYQANLRPDSGKSTTSKSSRCLS